MSQPSIVIPVDLTNPGQFFACCGLLELADRLWPGAEGWFDGNRFSLCRCGTLDDIHGAFREMTIDNTMCESDRARVKELAAIKEARKLSPEEEADKKRLESLRRELPIVLHGPVRLHIDWFTDNLAGGSRFKTWAGQQSVLDIAQNMHRSIDSGADLWGSRRKSGLPFNFDSDLGSQGSALDIGFSFDPLAGSELTRIEGACKPALELLSFVGLQRFRPREVQGQNRFVYVAWTTPLVPSVAATVACEAVPLANCKRYAFSLLYRTKYLKSFLPATRTEGDRDE